MPYQDRKSTRLNSSHGSISYAVFCLKKKKNEIQSQKALGCSLLLETKNHSHTQSLVRWTVHSTAARPCLICLLFFVFFFFFLMIRRPPKSPLFPSPPLSR